MGLADCGVTFYVPQRPRRTWILPTIVCAVVTALSLPWGLSVLPFAAWVLVLVCIGGVRAVPPVLVANDHVAFRGRSMSFREARRVRIRGSRVVLDGSGRSFAIDASLLDVRSRSVLVKHLEARMLLRRGGRRRRGERSALEAFYVFGATAVRVRKRTVLEILPSGGPWSTGIGRVYVRRASNASSAYRTNAWTDAIEVGSLENEFAEAVR